MCLSTVYKNNMEPASVIMKNVMRIDCAGDRIILTDVMERQTELEAELLRADLVEGYVILRERA